MGLQVRIFDVARRLIEGAGLNPGSDVPIVFSGTRPGEKLHEELTLSTEDARKTRHPAIWVGRIDAIDVEQVEHGIEDLERLATSMDDEAVVARLMEIVPEYCRATPAPDADEATTAPSLVAIDGFAGPAFAHGT
jgi:FlaA1/EpsC-like NDP-sugar epimerase